MSLLPNDGSLRLVDLAREETDPLLFGAGVYRGGDLLASFWSHSPEDATAQARQYVETAYPLEAAEL